MAICAAVPLETTFCVVWATNTEIKYNCSGTVAVKA